MLGPAADGSKAIHRLKTPPRTRCSGRGRSRTSPGRATSTSPPAPECGRCQSQCPAWNTGKPLSQRSSSWILQATICSPRRPTIFGDKAHGHRRPANTEGRVGRSVPTIHTTSLSPASNGCLPTLHCRPPGRWWATPLPGRHRPRCAVVVHHLRRLCRTVPGGHRAHRPHRRHAPLPGHDGAGVPRQVGGLCKNLETKGQPVGPELRSGSPGSVRWVRRSGLRQGCRLVRRVRVPVLGSAAPAPSMTAPRRPPRRSPNCSPPPG